MNSYSNHEDMNPNMMENFGNEQNLAPSMMDPRMFETAPPSAGLSGPAHGMDYRASGGGNDLPPYTTVPDISQNAFPDPFMDGSYAEPDYDQSQNNPFANLPTVIDPATKTQQKLSYHEAKDSAVLTKFETSDFTETLPVQEAQNWTTLTKFGISDFTQNSITSLPPFQALYNAYIASYTDATTTNATRMRYAQAFAFTMLKHYYPASQHFTVEPTSLGPIAKHGMSFILQANDGSDIWRDLPAKPSSKKAKKKGSLSKKQRDSAAAAAQTEEYFHGLNYIGGLNWDWIEPQDIAGFVVHRRIKLTDKQTGTVSYETRPYTYLAIMIDTFDELPRFSDANTLQRSDVLADVLCRNAELAEAHAILFYGPVIEFYAFRDGNEWVDDEGGEQTGSLQGSEQKARNTEPMMWLLQGDDEEKDRVIDIRTQGLEVVDEAMRDVVTLEVEWSDGAIAFGYVGGGGATEVFRREAGNRLV